ncbi:restriction endonuclease [Paenibacillus sp. J5C_2022]|uniref:restriction endonuclease n=1 Tax=Paenibacillus sp. J5C2022 TaxID=2977129 RepID=UPI0021CFE693|nr:restriction endonuclease [Paenibacillus sp. J5C2022]MCU6708748.1 restriction endonuclease [Paenibacillus sp. J5C2022]
MARTYKSEANTISNLLRGLFILVGLAIYFTIPGLHWVFLFGILFCSVIISEIIGLIWLRKRRLAKSKRKSGANSRRPSQAAHRTSKETRSDENILASQLENLSGAEFERLLALYFRDQGYKVKEVGIGGNDGGVDLVIIDQRGEKTAVQAKCYSESNKVPVQTIRELVAAKRNHDCILSLLITTSDLTSPAKAEAEKFKVDYWHGAIVEQKLKAWGKWQPNKKVSGKTRVSAGKAELSTVRREVAAASENCSCGGTMVRRKSKQGSEFWGCSNFPSCRRTKSI